MLSHHFKCITESQGEGSPWACFLRHFALFLLVHSLPIRASRPITGFRIQCCFAHVQHPPAECLQRHQHLKKCFREHLHVNADKAFAKIVIQHPTRFHKHTDGCSRTIKHLSGMLDKESFMSTTLSITAASYINLIHNLQTKTNHLTFASWVILLHSVQVPGNW